ncbi:MAG: 16S rRNA (uracil(1498)-N(3))-methyltransferase [Phycisphaerales bacterium]|nr:16S rRNA (uracil(1498)-N(3))-methyltransferase [Phycisphaerales bacterium]
MPRHTIFLDEPPPPAGLPDGLLTIGGEEAKHAVRVKRVEAGEAVRLLDGRGGVYSAEVVEARRALVVRVRERRTEPRVTPAVEVWSATPKGDRLSQLIEGLSQAGAARWTALLTKLGVVEPGEHKIERCERIARESAKQAERAWIMEIGPPARFEEALRPPEGTRLVIADRHGAAYRASGEAAVRVLVGPEGGFTPEEFDAARAAGAEAVGLGPHVMRIETAGVIAAAIILGAHRA